MGVEEKKPNFDLGILETQGESRFFKNVWIKDSPQTPSQINRINLFSWYFLMHICLFLWYASIFTFLNYISHLICPSGGSAAINMFSNSKMPEFGLRGGGIKPNREFPPNFLAFFSDASKAFKNECFFFRLYFDNHPWYYLYFCLDLARAVSVAVSHR